MDYKTLDDFDDGMSHEATFVLVINVNRNGLPIEKLKKKRIKRLVITNENLYNFIPLYGEILEVAPELTLVHCKWILAAPKITRLHCVKCDVKIGQHDSLKELIIDDATVSFKH